MKQSIMQSLFLIFFLVVGFSEDYHLLQKTYSGWRTGRPQVQFSLSLPSPLPFFSYFTSRTWVHPQSHNTLSLCVFDCLGHAAISVFFSCQCLWEKCVHKGKMAFKGGDILISVLGADIKLKAIQLYLMMVLSAAWRLTSSKALSYFWGRGCNNIKARTH